MNSFDKTVFIGETETQAMKKSHFVVRCGVLFIAGMYSGALIEKLSDGVEKLLGKRLTGFFQLALNIAVIYLLLEKEYTFSIEFQKSLAGLFFVAAFFNSQPRLIGRFLD